MGRTLNSLAVSMRKRAEQVPQIGNIVAKAGTEAMLREWIEVMPVDTSEAISNTRIGVGERPAGQLPPYFYGRKGSTRGASAAEAFELGLAELSTKQPGEVLWLSNTAPHIGKLDSGSSIQFAGGFIPRALIVFHLAARKAAKEALRMRG